MKWLFEAPDGYYRGVIAINQQFPGPTIRARVGDMINITVINQLLDSTLAVHWHGVSQRGTPFMDGASGVTQFPIIPHQSFLYQVRKSPRTSSRVEPSHVLECYFDICFLRTFVFYTWLCIYSLLWMSPEHFGTTHTLRCRHVTPVRCVLSA